MRGKYIAQADLLDRDGQAVDVVEICDRRSLTYCLAECSRALANFEVLLNRGRIKLQDGSNE